MLRIFAVALLATTMSVSLAEAKGKPKVSLAPCQSELQVKGTCACGPAKIAQRECTVTLSGILARDNDFIEGISLALGSSFPGWGLFLSDSYSGASQKVASQCRGASKARGPPRTQYAAPQGMANQE